MTMPEIKTPLLAVDAVIVYPNHDIVLIERKFPPLGVALPGGFVEIGEGTRAACMREAKEEIGLDVCAASLIGVYDDPKRDPRRHVVSIAYLCLPLDPEQKPKAGDDAKTVALFNWHKKEEWPELVFDHLAILNRGMRMFFGG